MKNWSIEYERPPMRAIYHAVTRAESEQQVRDAVAKQQPGWRIRKITEAASTISDEWADFERECLPKPCSEIQRNEMRRSFYAGYVACLTEIGSRNPSIAHIQLLDEAQNFFNSLTKHN